MNNLRRFIIWLTRIQHFLYSSILSEKYFWKNTSLWLMILQSLLNMMMLMAFKILFQVVLLISEKAYTFLVKKLINVIDEGNFYFNKWWTWFKWTSIGNFAFNECNSLKEITIPSSVTWIWIFFSNSFFITWNDWKKNVHHYTISIWYHRRWNFQLNRRYASLWKMIQKMENRTFW